MTRHATAHFHQVRSFSLSRVTAAADSQRVPPSCHYDACKRYIMALQFSVLPFRGRQTLLMVAAPSVDHG